MYFDNILINFDQILSFKNNFDSFFIISQIDKFFNFSEILSLNEKLMFKEINNIIGQITQKVKDLSLKQKRIFFFLFPQDTSDNYLEFLNFKKKGKNWIINYIN